MLGRGAGKIRVAAIQARRPAPAGVGEESSCSPAWSAGGAPGDHLARWDCGDPDFFRAAAGAICSGAGAESPARARTGGAPVGCFRLDELHRGRWRGPADGEPGDGEPGDGGAEPSDAGSSAGVWKMAVNLRRPELGQVDRPEQKDGPADLRTDPAVPRGRTDRSRGRRRSGRFETAGVAGDDGGPRSWREPTPWTTFLSWTRASCRRSGRSPGPPVTAAATRGPRAIPLRRPGLAPSGSAPSSVGIVLVLIDGSVSMFGGLAAGDQGIRDPAPAATRPSVTSKSCLWTTYPTCAVEPNRASGPAGTPPPVDTVAHLLDSRRPQARPGAHDGVRAGLARTTRPCTLLGRFARGGADRHRADVCRR